MELEKKMWIRPVTFNFISVTVIAVFFVLIAVLGVLAAGVSIEAKQEVKTDIEEIYEGAGDEEIGDVEGYGIIANGIAYLAVAGAQIFAAIIAILCGLGAVVIFFPALLARLLYKDTDGRILAYRIIMGFDYGIITAIALGLLFEMELSAASIIPGVMLTVVVCGIVNTYSERIRR